MAGIEEGGPGAGLSPLLLPVRTLCARPCRIEHAASPQGTQPQRDGGLQTPGRQWAEHSPRAELWTAPWWPVPPPAQQTLTAALKVRHCQPHVHVGRLIPAVASPGSCRSAEPEFQPSLCSSYTPSSLEPLTPSVPSLEDSDVDNALRPLHSSLKDAGWDFFFLMRNLGQRNSAPGLPLQWIHETLPRFLLCARPWG